MIAARFRFALLAISTLSACDGSNVSPSPTQSPSPRGGSIAVQAMAPASGATLPVRECSLYPSSLNLKFWEMCAEQLRMTFDVEFENDVTTAVVTVGFYNGLQRCGLATSPPAPLRRGIRTSFEAQAILLSDEEHQLLCALPAETTRMVVQLWEKDRPASPLLTREFAHLYRFVQP